jgi:hypothetical protein
MPLFIPRSRPSLLIWSISFFCCSLLVLFAYNMYPVPDGDSIGFVPAIKSYATTGLLQNKLYIRPHTIDPSGLGRFLSYTPGMTVYIGLLMRLFGREDYQSAYVLLSLVRCASVIIFSKLIIISLEPRTSSNGFIRLFIAAALVISNAFFLFASNGRPEILSIFFVSSALLAAFSIKSQINKHILIQICIGLLFPVSIANALISMCIYAIYIVIDIKITRLRFACLLLAIFLSIIFLVSSYAVVGVSLGDGLNGLAISAKAALLDYKLNLGFVQSLSYYKSWMVFAILAVVQFFRLSFAFWRENSTTQIDRALLIASVSVLTISAYYFGGRYASNHYTLYAFLPLYQLLAFQLFINSRGHARRLISDLFALAIIVAAVLSLLQPLQAALLFPYYLVSGSTYNEMKRGFERIDLQNCSPVYTIAVAWLDDKQSGSEYMPSQLGGVVETTRMKTENDNRSCVIAFVQEVNNNSQAPIGMQLISDLTDHSPYTSLLRSLRLLNSPKGYSFRAYRGSRSMHLN